MSKKNTLAAKAHRRAEREQRHTRGRALLAASTIDALLAVVQMRDPQKPARFTRAQRRHR